jgi:quinol monooxygenase YgiN
MRHNHDEGAAMATDDTTCSIHPYFKVHEGKIADFKAVAERMVAETGTEPGCLYYGFTYDGDQIHGPADEIEKLREPMAPLGAQFYMLECGFCR